MLSIWVTPSTTLSNLDLQALNRKLDFVQLDKARTLDSADIEIIYTKDVYETLAQLSKHRIQLVTTGIQNDAEITDQYNHTNYFSGDINYALLRYLTKSRARGHVLEAGIKIRREQIERKVFSIHDLIGVEPQHGFLQVKNISIGVDWITDSEEMEKLKKYLGGTDVVQFEDALIQVCLFSEKTSKYAIHLRGYDSERFVDTRTEVYIYTVVPLVQRKLKLVASIIRLGVDTLNANAICYTPSNIDIRLNLQKSLDVLES